MNTRTARRVVVAALLLIATIAGTTGTAGAGETVPTPGGSGYNGGSNNGSSSGLNIVALHATAGNAGAGKIYIGGYAVSGTLKSLDITYTISGLPVTRAAGQPFTTDSDGDISGMFLSPVQIVAGRTYVVCGSSAARGDSRAMGPDCSRVSASRWERTPDGDGRWAVVCDNVADQGVEDVNRNGRQDPGENRIIVAAPNFPGCHGYSSNTAGTRPPKANCPVGFEVWRFYGTVSNPADVRTTSRALIPGKDCVGAETYLQPMHPEDDPAYPQGAVNGPHRDSYQTDPTNGLVSALHVEPDGPSDDGLRYSTMPPFERTGSCTRHVNPDRSYRRLFVGGDLYNEPFAAEARQAFAAAWSDYAAKETPRLANAMFDVASGNGATGEVTFGDTVRCGSPMDFSIEVTAASYDRDPELLVPERKLVGICWLPVMRNNVLYSSGTGDTWHVPWQADYDGGANETYYYGTGTGVPGAPDFGYTAGISYRETPGNASATAREADVMDDAFLDYRRSIQAEIVSRGAFNALPPYLGKHPNYLGAPPSQGVGSAAWNAQCRAGLGNVYVNDTGASGSSRSLDNVTGVEIETMVPNFGQVGGTGKDATITTETNNILCGANPCTIDDQGPFVNTVHADMAVAGLEPGAGYRVSDPYQSASDGTGAMSLNFLQGTRPDNDVRVTTSGTADVTADSVFSRFVMVCYNPMMGLPCKSYTVSQPQQVTKTVPLVSRYPNGQTFPVIRTTPTPLDDRNNTSGGEPRDEEREEPRDEERDD